MPDKDPTETQTERAYPASERRLSNVMRALPESELVALMERLGIRVDPAKRLDAASQTARVLVGLPEIRDPSRVSSASYDLLVRLAEVGGRLCVDARPPGLGALMGRGIVFARRDGSKIELVLPHAYVVQLPTWSSEDPRSIRALLAQASFETTSAIAAHYLGRPSTPPIALALEAAWDVLSNEKLLRAEIDGLAHVERRLLESIDALGGEVETAELLDLEREPIRLRSAKGVSTTRRGAGFALERRGLLIPVHPNRHVVPTEVARIVGAERRRSLQDRQKSVRARLKSADYLPRRAVFARDPGILAMATALWFREAATQRDSTAELKASIGVPRSLVTRLSQSFARPQHETGFITVLARAVGLFDPIATQPSSPSGAVPLGGLQERLFRVWRSGAVWDEGRNDPEVLRAPEGKREPSPIRAIRDAVLEALLELPSDRWFPYLELEEYIRNDARMEGAMHLMRRWSDRLSTEAAPVPVMPLNKIVLGIVLGSLTRLGLLDIGVDGDLGDVSFDLDRDVRAWIEAPDALVDDHLSALLIRQNARGRRLIGQSVGEPEAALSGEGGTRSRFVEKLQLRLGDGVKVAEALALSAVSEVCRTDEALEVLISPAAISRAIARGSTPDELRDRLTAVAELTPELKELLDHASVVVGKGALVAVGAFLWVDNPDVRDMLRQARTTAEFFLDPSPPGGLLVAAGVDLERLVRRCRGLGVEIDVAADLTLRASRGSNRAFTPPPSAVTGRDTTEGSARSGTRAVGRPTPAAMTRAVDPPRAKR
jgi:hypothetical protein